MEGEWSCYRSGQFNGRCMVITEVANLILMQAEWSSYRGLV